MVGFIIFSVILLASGFFGGMMAKHLIDRDAMREASIKIRALKSENEYLNKIRSRKVIEIHDPQQFIEDIDFPNSL